MRAIFQNRAVSPYKHFFFPENFCPVCDNLVSADMNIEKCGRKRTYFFMELKTRAEADEKRILCKSTLRLNVLYLKQKVRQMYFLAKTLNLHNTLIPFRESSFCARLLCLCDVICNFFQLCIMQKLIF